MKIESKEELDLQLSTIGSDICRMREKVNGYKEKSEEINKRRHEREIDRERCLGEAKRLGEKARLPYKCWGIVKVILFATSIVMLLYSFASFFSMSSIDEYRPIRDLECALAADSADYYDAYAKPYPAATLCIVLAYVLCGISAWQSAFSKNKKLIRCFILTLVIGAIIAVLVGFGLLVRDALYEQLPFEMQNLRTELYLTKCVVPLLCAVLLCEAGHVAIVAIANSSKKNQALLNNRADQLQEEIDSLAKEGIEAALSCGLQSVAISSVLENRSAIKEKRDRILERERCLNQAQEELESLVGLHSVKEAVSTWKSRIEWDLARGNETELNLNFLFLGNPGTGKTEVARIMGRLLYGLGLIDRFDVVEVDRSSLVSEYVGHTPQKTNEVIETAHGGVLFVDEAYALCRRGAQNDHGREAVDTLVKALEDKRGEMAFIFAGYEAEMKSDFLDSNPGLESRFADENRFYFRDYSANELLEIFKRMVLAKGLSLDRGAEGGLQAFLEKRSSNSCFGNARDVRNTVQKLMNIHSRRWAQDKDAIPRDIITKEDVGLL